MQDAVAVGEAFFDHLLGVIPGAAARGHRDGHEQTRDDHAHQHGADGREGLRLAGDGVDDKEQHDGAGHRQ